MAMTPGNQAITGGTVLRSPAIQSPNYSPGVSGWIIKQDGTAEFNSGTFRGSIEVGSLTGQHFWVNNPSTGDVIDVYNSANKLVMSIDSTGRLVATSSVSTANVVINGANLLFEDTAQTPLNQILVNGAITANSTALNLFGGIPANYTGSGAGASVTLNTGITPASENVAIEQRGVQGVVLQTNSSANANQLIAVGLYSGTVAGGAGLVTFNHNCGFTPAGGLVGPLTNFSQWNWSNAFGTHGFTSTQAQLMPFFPGGASLGNGQVITFYAWFWG